MLIHSVNAFPQSEMADCTEKYDTATFVCPKVQPAQLLAQKTCTAEGHSQDLERLNIIYELQAYNL